MITALTGLLDASGSSRLEARLTSALTRPVRPQGAPLDVVLGGDPLAAKQTKRSIVLYSELAEQHIAHAKTYQRSWWSTEGLLKKHVIPRFGRMRLDEITSQDVAKFLADKASEGLSPSSCAKLRVLLGRSYQLALEWRMAGAELNPARGVKLPPFDNRRTRYLDRPEIDRLLAAAASSPNASMLAIINLLRLTGMRLRGLLEARWDGLNLARRTLHLPMCKNGKGRFVPLAQEAVDVINGLPRFEGCAYLLPNPKTGKPFVSIKRAWQTIRKEARLGDLRLHDLRHTFIALANAGVDLHGSELAFGHADLKSTSRYVHVSDGVLLAAVDAGAAGMASDPKQA